MEAGYPNVQATARTMGGVETGSLFCRQPSGGWGLQATSGLKQYMGEPGKYAVAYLDALRDLTLYADSIIVICDVFPFTHAAQFALHVMVPPCGSRLLADLPGQ
jgi:hypothetical protein